MAAAEKIKLLCILMETATEFQPDFDAAASVFGIAQPRNVTRKINAIIEPHGYTMSRRKIVKINSSTTASASKPTKPTKTKVKSKSSNRKAAVQTADNEGKTSDSSFEHEAEDEEGENEYSPATKAIMEAMAGSDVTPDDESSTEEGNGEGGNDNGEDVA